MPNATDGYGRYGMHGMYGVYGMYGTYGLYGMHVWMHLRAFGMHFGVFGRSVAPAAKSHKRRSGFFRELRESG